MARLHTPDENITEFLADRCITGPDAGETSIKEFRAAYREWCWAKGRQFLGVREQLKRHGITTHIGKNGARFYSPIRLKDNQ